MSVPPRLSMRGVRKAFGATQALAGVALEVRPGEVMALLGENGAGKTTLMNVLAGVVRPDAGMLELDGEPFFPRDPLDARARGIAMIHQELAQAPHLTVAENLFLGRERTRHGVLARAAMQREAQALLQRLGHPDIAPGARAGTLAPAARQIVEIARALGARARLLLMDEPASSLGPAECARLFALVQEIAAAGTAVVYISHSFREVRAVARRFTVLRDGATVARGELAQTSDDALVQAMAGRGIARPQRAARAEPGEVMVEAHELAGARLPRRASLVLRRGEVLGIFGMAGAGRTELLRALFGLDPVRSGSITVAGSPDRGRAPRRRWAQRVGYVSEDRALEGLALGRTVAENLTLTRLAPFTRAGVIALGTRDAAAAAWIERLAIKTRGGAQRVRELSGGNQQKVALARLLHHECEVLLLDEPTRGIDVSGRAEIERLILELRGRGKAVLVVSSYIPELLALADRIAVMRKGELTQAAPVASWDEASLLAAAAGGAS